jgi:Pyridoxamine 5'-phosphate oxidase
MTEIPEIYLDLLLEKRTFAHLATVMPDGSPQNTPVWFDFTDGKIRVNSALGRTKVRNMKLGAKVALQEPLCEGGRCARDVRNLRVLRPGVS